MLTIRTIETEQEKIELSDIADTTLGYMYVLHEEIRDRAIVALWNNQLAGFALTDFYEVYDPHCDSVGIIDTVAVHPDYQGKGIATVLVGAASTRLAVEGASLVESYAWKDFDGIHLRKPLERNGFKEIEWFPKFWQNLPYTGFECATCGYPCLCTAVLYRKWINKGKWRNPL